MNRIVVTDKLTEAQLRKAKGLKEIGFLQGEINAVSGFPAFYLMYNKDKLIGIISLFVPNRKECELYAAMLPEYRKKNCFFQLYKRAYKAVRTYGIEKIYFPAKPDSWTEKGIVKWVGAKCESSQYLMSCELKNCQKPRGILTFECHVHKNKGIFQTFWEKRKIGSIHLEFGKEAAFLYHVEIKPEFRKKGYGTETLLLALEYLRKSGCQKALLHVSSFNKTAYGMYCRHGFVCMEQIDYWRKNVKR